MSRSPEHEQLLRSLERDEANLAEVKKGIARAQSILDRWDDCPLCGHLEFWHDDEQGCLVRSLELDLPACGCRMPRETNGPPGETIRGKRETGGKP